MFGEQDTSGQESWTVTSHTTEQKDRLKGYISTMLDRSLDQAWGLNTSL